MHVLALAAIALAGCAYCLAAWRSWRALGGQGAPDAPEAMPPGPAHGGEALLGIAVAAHSLAVVAAFADRTHPEILDCVLGAWAAMAAALFIRSAAGGSIRALLALPMGGAALLIAGAGLAAPPVHTHTGSAVTILHAVCMSAYLAAVLVAGAGGLLYLLAARQLRTATVRGFRLPALPTLDRLTERGLAVAAALLLAGVATGGIALHATHSGSVIQPTILIALVNLAVLVAVLLGRITRRLAHRTLAGAAVVCVLLGGGELVSLLVTTHG